MDGYCVVIEVENYHPQLCSNDGTHLHPMTFEDATKAATELSGDEYKTYRYVVMGWQEYLDHIPNCKDCAFLVGREKNERLPTTRI